MTGNQFSKVLVALLLLSGFQAMAQGAKQLDFNLRYASLNDGPISCGGSAELQFSGYSALLKINSAHCQFVEVNGRLETINPMGYSLGLNQTKYFRITSGGRFNSIVEVRTFLPHQPPTPAPYPTRPPQYSRLDIYGDERVPVPLPSCGGFAQLRRGFGAGAPQIEFSEVRNCTYYTVLSAEPGARTLDATENRLVGYPSHWGNRFPLPNRWGQNIVILRLQSAHPEIHHDDIYVHFIR